MTNGKATTDQVRKSYADRGFIVRIDAAGHVEFREAADLPWIEGRWVSEYVITDGIIHLQ